MKTLYILSISIVSLVLASCVSNKKYAELESEVERLRATEAVLNSVSQRPNLTEDPQAPDEDPEKQELRNHVDGLNKELHDLRMKLDAMGAGEMSREQIEAYEMEKQRQHELETMKLHMSQKEGSMKDSERMISEQFQKLILVEKGARAAMEPYQNNEVFIDEKSNYVIVTVKQSLILNSAKDGLSASGETFVNRLKPVLEIARGTNLMINGVSDSQEDQTNAFAAAKLLDSELQKISTYKTFSAPVMVTDCDNTYSGRRTQCDKIELVFGPELEESLQLMRMGR